MIRIIEVIMVPSTRIKKLNNHRGVATSGTSGGQRRDSTASPSVRGGGHRLAGLQLPGGSTQVPAECGGAGGCPGP